MKLNKFLLVAPALVLASCGEVTPSFKAYSNKVTKLDYSTKYAAKAADLTNSVFGSVYKSFEATMEYQMVQYVTTTNTNVGVEYTQETGTTIKADMQFDATNKRAHTIGTEVFYENTGKSESASANLKSEYFYQNGESKNYAFEKLSHTYEEKTETTEQTAASFFSSMLSMSSLFGYIAMSQAEESKIEYFADDSDKLYTQTWIETAIDAGTTETKSGYAKTVLQTQFGDGVYTFNGSADNAITNSNADGDSVTQGFKLTAIFTFKVVDKVTVEEQKLADYPWIDD